MHEPGDVSPINQDLFPLKNGKDNQKHTRAGESAAAPCEGENLECLK